jgi:hypothetical protein
MPSARRGFRVAAAGLCLSAAVAAFAAANRGGREPAVVARDEHGRELGRLALPPHGRFALAYRNSLYRAAAEERFAATADGKFALVELTSDSIAVLEEYYGIKGRPVETGSDGRRYRYTVRLPPAFRELRVAATELGHRTLVVGSERVALWRLVPDGDVVVISVEPGG